MHDPKDISTSKKGASYMVPFYFVQTGIGLVHAGFKEIKFVKGVKDNESMFRQDGFMTETLLTVSNEYLKDVQVGDLVDEDTQDAMNHITLALQALSRRAEKRRLAGVQATMKP